MAHVLTLCGSLRAASSNRSLLRATERIAPVGVVFEHFDGIGELPHFNPDIEAGPLPAPVAHFRARVGHADALLISCPEYARGIPGAFKNALDWLVGGHEFPGKPIALFNASPRASDAQAALRLVLSTMSGRVVDEAAITVALLSMGMEAEAIAADPALRPKIEAGLAALLAAASSQSG
ncbi:MAG: NAD(P)H-dependent oxidoreductase [Candidatus Kaistia colombiensis]|nr:MAG: NAD(P)H-dependent oxidoreductase [Kaistia sp.]